MKVRDLVKDGQHDQISSQKLWFNIGYAVVTFGYIWSIVHGQSFESATLVYAPFVGGVRMLDKYLLLKFGGTNGQLHSN